MDCLANLLLYGTIRFIDMHTAVVIACMHKGQKFPKMILQLFRGNVRQIQRGKPRRIHDIAFLCDLNQLRMSRGVLPALYLFADFARI